MKGGNSTGRPAGRGLATRTGSLTLHPILRQRGDGNDHQRHPYSLRVAPFGMGCTPQRVAHASPAFERTCVPLQLQMEDTGSEEAVTLGGYGRVFRSLVPSVLTATTFLDDPICPGCVYS